MSFDRFLLAVESRDLSQADKSIIRVSSFSILQLPCNIYRLRGNPIVIIFPAICEYYRVFPQHTQSFNLMSVCFFCDSHSPFP